MSNEKRAYNISYSRILFIDKEISEGHYPNANQLSKKCEVSVSTIKRDISYMRDILRVPIQYDLSKKGHYYTDTSFRLPAIYTSLDSVFSIALAYKLLLPYRNTPIFNRIKATLENLDSRLIPSNEKDALWLSKRISFMQNESIIMIEPHIWDVIMLAMYQNRYIAFCYNNGYDKKYMSNSITILPNEIICKSGIWYLLGSLKDDSGKNAQFSMSRIVKAKLLEKYKPSFIQVYATLPKNEDEPSEESVEEARLFRCKVLFFGEGRINAKNNLPKISNIISVEEIDDNTSEFIFDTSDLLQTLSLVFSQGSNSMVLEPSQLVDMYKETTSKMAKKSRSH